MRSSLSPTWLIPRSDGFLRRTQLFLAYVAFARSSIGTRIRACGASQAQT